MPNDNQGLGDFFSAIFFSPQTIQGSGRWKYWRTIIDGKQCIICFSKNGTIYETDEEIEPEPPVHPNCRCKILPLKAIRAGEATLDGRDGADWQLAHSGALPDEYISKKEAEMIGWKSWLGNLSEVAQGKIIGGDIFKNKKQQLPDAPGRIWYEADINYAGGYRSSQRILYSSDGIVFVTYDHYRTFYEIVE